MPKYRVTLFMSNDTLAPTSNVMETHSIYESLLPRIKLNFEMAGQLSEFTRLLGKLGTETLVKLHYKIEEI